MRFLCKIGIHKWETEMFHANLNLKRKRRSSPLRLKYLIRICEECGKKQEMNLNSPRFAQKYWRDPICFDGCEDKNQKIRILRKIYLIKLGLSENPPGESPRRNQ